MCPNILCTVSECYESPRPIKRLRKSDLNLRNTDSYLQNYDTFVYFFQPYLHSLLHLLVHPELPWEPAAKTTPSSQS